MRNALFLLLLAACGEATFSSSESGGSTSSAASSSVASAASSSASTSSSSGQGGAGGASPCGGLDDEFDDPATLTACWKVREVVEGSPTQLTTLDINTTTKGALAIVPKISRWFEDDVGPLVYKEISGSFVVTARLRAVRASNPALPPSTLFNSVGLLVRDPVAAKVPGHHNWIMWDVGYQGQYQNQDVGLGSEGKITVDSSSILTLTSTQSVSGLLSICRVGQDVMLSQRLEGEAGWTVAKTYPKAPLPDAVQVGIITNAHAMPDLRGEIDFIHFAVPTTLADCTALAK